MKHGVRIPREKRDDMAKLAAGLAISLGPDVASRAVANLFEVSSNTARHLISRGRFLTQPTEDRGHNAR